MDIVTRRYKAGTLTNIQYHNNFAYSLSSSNLTLNAKQLRAMSKASKVSGRCEESNNSLFTLSSIQKSIAHND
jgi:hypothetical protein